MEIQFRKAISNDRDDLKDLLNRSLEYKLSLGDMSWSKEPYEDEEVDKKISKGRTYNLLVSDEIVGTVAVSREDPEVWGEELGTDGLAVYLHRLCTSRDHAGQNLGKVIIDFVADMAQQNNKQFIRLDCDVENEGLCGYYEGLGFKRRSVRNVQKYTNRPVAALYELEV